MFVACFMQVSVLYSPYVCVNYILYGSGGCHEWSPFEKELLTKVTVQSRYNFFSTISHFDIEKKDFISS